MLFGSNDACIPESPTNQHVPLQTYKKNLKTIITHPLISAHRPKIILVTPPPIDEVTQEEKDATNNYLLCRRASTTAKYAEAVRDLGTDVGGDIAVFDLWNVIMNEALDKTPGHDSNGPILGTKELGNSKALTNLMPDGLHFGGHGYTIFFKALLSTIEAKWPSTDPKTESWIFPEWRLAPRIKYDT